jgi:hypothetical protein
MRGAGFLLVPVLLLAGCGHGRPERTEVVPIPQPRAEGEWAVMLEVTAEAPGAPVDGAVVQALLQSSLGGEVEPVPVAEGMTDASGRATLDRLPPEGVLLRALRPGYRVNAVVSQPPAPPEDGGPPFARVPLRLTREG